MTVEKNGNTELASIIENSLKGDLLVNAKNFVTFLNENDMVFKDSTVTYKSGVVCYMHIGGEEYPGPWTIWSEGDYCNESDDVSMSLRMKETAWENVNICGNCGSNCSPGKQTTIFGKKYDNVCNAVMAFNCPDEAKLECVKQILHIRKSIIDSMK
jgi:hypothetical protein